jgi:hypothetical protein
MKEKDKRGLFHSFRCIFGVIRHRLQIRTNTKKGQKRPRFHDEYTDEESDELWTDEDEAKEKLWLEIESYAAPRVERQVREEIEKGVHEEEIKQIMEELRKTGNAKDERKLRAEAIDILIEDEITTTVDAELDAKLMED